MKIIDKIHVLQHLCHKKAFIKEGIKGSNIPMLVFIKKHGGCTLVEIANFLMVTPASVTLSVKKLEQKGLIKKLTDESNLRCKKIYITEKGATLTEKGKIICDETYNFCIEGISEKDMRTTRETLEHILRNLCQKADYDVSQLNFEEINKIRNELSGKENNKYD